MTKRRREHFYLTLCFLFLVNSVFAQNISRYRVLDEQNKGVNSAIVLTLRAQDSTLLETQVTDVDGGFEVASMVCDSGLLFDVSCPGYVRFFGQFPTTTDHIVLKSVDVDGGEINDIVVAGKRSTFERNGDRFTFRVSDQLEIVQSSTVYDMLKLTPLVTVSESDNSISVSSGGGSTQIYVNGRRSRLSSEGLTTYLKGIPATLLGSIDVLPIANSTYAGNGAFSVIDIHLKRRPDDGVSGMMNIGTTQWHSNSQEVGLNLDIRKNKLGANVSVWGNNTGNERIQERENTLFLESNNRTISDTKTFERSVDGGCNLKLDYDISDRQVIGVVFSSDFKRNEGYATGMTHYENATGALDSLYRTGINNHGYNRNLSANLNYQLRTDNKGSVLTVDVDYVDYLNLGYRTTVFDRLNEDGSLDYTLDRMLQRLPQTVKAWTSRVNYTHQFGRWGSLSVGGDFQSTTSDDDSYYASDDWDNKNTNLSNHFVYTETLPSLFASYSVQWNNKFSTTVGSRLEYTHTQAEQHTTSDVVTTSRFRILPTLFLNYSPNKDHNLSYSLSNTQKHPGYQFMNSFRVYSSPTSYSEGNPYLRPEKQINQSLDYMYKGRLVFGVKHIIRKDMPVYDWQPNGDAGLKRTVINLAHEYQTNVILGMTGVYLNGYWMANNYLIYSYLDRMGVSSDGLFKEYYSVIMLNLNNTIVLSKKHQWMLGVSYFWQSGVQSKRMSAPSRDNLNISLTKNWERCNLQLSYSDSFDTLESYYVRTTTNQMNNTNYTYTPPRYFSVTLSYKFGKQVRSARQRSTSSDGVTRRL